MEKSKRMNHKKKRQPTTLTAHNRTDSMELVRATESIPQ